MTRLAKATAVVVATFLGLAALWELSGPVLVFLISLVVAAAARAPVEYLARRGLPKPVALAGTYLVGLLVLAGLVLAVVYLVSGELRRAMFDFERLYDYTSSHSTFLPWIDRTVNERMPAAGELLTSLVGNHGEQAARLVLGTAFGLLSTVIDGVFIVVLSIYWTVDREYFERLWFSLLPLPHRISMRTLWRSLETELGAYARSEMAQSLLAGIVLGAVFRLLGLQYPTLLALVAALSWLVPWLGAIITLAALAIVELPALVLDWPGSLLPVSAAALLTVLVFAMLEFAVEPRLFNRRRYNSLLIVLAVMALAQTFGIMGLLLGPVAAVAIQVAVEHAEREQIVARNPPPDWAALEGRIAETRVLAASSEEIPREWMSILDRLAALLANVRMVFGEETDAARIR